MIWLRRDCSNCDHTCDGHIFISFVLPQFTLFPFHSFPFIFMGKNQCNKLGALRVCDSTAQLVELCSANAEATGSNPVEAPNIVFFFFGLLRNCLNCDSLRWSHIHFICISAVHIISILYFNHFVGKSEFYKLANSPCMALHSSADRALQRERRSHGFESR